MIRASPAMFKRLQRFSPQQSTATAASSGQTVLAAPLTLLGQRGLHQRTGFGHAAAAASPQTITRSQVTKVHGAVFDGFVDAALIDGFAYTDVHREHRLMWSRFTQYTQTRIIVN